MNEISNKILTKKELHKFVNNKILDLGINLSDIDNYKINSKEVAHKICKNLNIEYINFNEIKICGILYKGTNTTTIGLNSKRSEKGQNFDCAHEIMHYLLHESNIFYCNEKNNNHFEWQANEGAAQLLMPYQVFIPKFLKMALIMHDFYRYEDVFLNKLTEHLSYNFNVGNLAIENRIKNLKNEIFDYAKNNCINIKKIIPITNQNLNRKKDSFSYVI